MSLFQSNLRKQIRKLPKFLKFVRISHNYSKLFTGVLIDDVQSKVRTAVSPGPPPIRRRPPSHDDLQINIGDDSLALSSPTMVSRAMPNCKNCEMFFVQLTS